MMPVVRHLPTRSGPGGLCRWIAAIGVMVLLGACQAPPPREPRALPATIPALQEWHAASDGEFRLGMQARIVRAAQDAAALEQISQMLADDLGALFGRDFAQAVASEADVRPGDVYLALETGPGAAPATAVGGREGYALRIAEHIALGAASDAGVFHGTQTLLQLLRQSERLPQGAVRDWPQKAERGLMVDVGRKYFTPAWLREEIRELAYLKLNTLHLHLTDNEGFRIESVTHPEIVSPEHLSKQEVRELIAFAAQHHITVVPEIDMPGHMAAILAAHPDLQLYDPQHTPPTRGAASYGFIDLSNPRSWTLMQELLDEFLPLFPGPYWHIGADEYVRDYTRFPQLLDYARSQHGPGANGKDVYLGFINWADARIRAAGKTARAWNDGIDGGATVTVSPDVVIEFWTDRGLTPQQHLDAGHMIANESWDPTYYVLGTGVTPDLSWLYGAWQPGLFQKRQTIRTQDEARNLGSLLHVWCDNPAHETEIYVAARIAQPLRVLAQRLWGSPNPVPTYAQFETLSGKLGSHPDAAARVRQ